MEPREGWGPLRGALVASRTGARTSKVLLMFPQAMLLLKPSSYLGPEQQARVR